MNFLSHYYHEQPCDDPYFAAGLMLPDILSNYSHRAGTVVKLLPWRMAKPQTAELSALVAGIKQHYAVDGAFHPSDFFEENTHFIRRLITNYPFTCFARREYAVAHILLEIILDRSILRHSRKVCDLLYALLHQVDQEYVEVLLTQNGHIGHACGAAGHFDRFRVQRFLYDYMDDHRLVELLGYINRRLGNPPLTDNDRLHLKDLIYAIETSLHHQKFPKFRTDS